MNSVTNSIRPTAVRGLDRRRGKRWALNIGGKILDLDRGFEGSCTVCDLSPTGATLKTSYNAAAGAKVVLYLDGFGRFDAEVVHRHRMILGVRFKCSAAKQARTADQIAVFLERGMEPETRLRGAIRTKDSSPLTAMTLTSGQLERCEIVDIALSGAQLKTMARPGIGESVSFGAIRAVIIRHTDVGVAVEFSHVQ